jgi:hypothetical protein
MAVATYSISVGTTQEANSLSLITDVLSLIPDNTSKEITPKDVRDAIFSSWESSVIRYTSDGSTDYIGIDRNTVKDVKIFLGKKEISGTTVLTGLLGSDTDIFLYNTKSDSALTQNFKMSLLAGSDTGLFSTAPYISSTYVSGSPNYLSLDFVNPGTYGTINIESGSSAEISVNNLLFPSTTYVNQIVTGATPAQASDGSTLLLATRAGGVVELLTPSSLGGSLGSTGSTTNIYGSPVLVNGNALEYTNLTPTVTQTGGVAIGTTFSNVPIVNMLTAILYPYIPPAATLLITTTLGANNTLERNHNSSTTIAYQYSLTKATYNITLTRLQAIRNDGVVVVNDPSLSTLSGPGLITQTFTNTRSLITSDISALSNGPCIMTFSVVPQDGTSSATASQRIEFVYPYFYGYNATDVTNSSEFNSINSSLSKRIDIYGSQSLAINGTGYLYFGYPSYYGVLSSIQDGSGWIEYSPSNLATWTYSLYNSVTGTNWSGGQYYVFKKFAVTTTNPTQTYKFNF